MAGAREVVFYRLIGADRVRGYPWDALLLDYQQGTTNWLFDPVRDQTNGSGRDYEYLATVHAWGVPLMEVPSNSTVARYWWPKLQCLTGAFVDLRCADLLA